MIEASIFHSNQGICAFRLSGHSGYGEEGSDIVCAAVSAIAQYIIQAATETMHIPCRYELQDGLITFSFSEETTGDQKQRMQDFLLPFEATMQQLSEQYGEYLKTKRLEV